MVEVPLTVDATKKKSGEPIEPTVHILNTVRTLVAKMVTFAEKTGQNLVMMVRQADFWKEGYGFPRILHDAVHHVEA